MNEYPIEGLMNTAMNSIKEMIDVNTIIGDPIEANNNIVIIPVSKVNFGFAAGGSEFKGKTMSDKNAKNPSNETVQNIRMPFGGGSGAGVGINPIAFIVVSENGVRLLPIDHISSVDKLLDLVPDLIDKVNIILEKQLKRIEDKNKKENSVITNPEKTTIKTDDADQAKKYDIEYDETSDM